MIHKLLFFALFIVSFQSIANDNHKIAVDQNGNVFVFGEFYGEISFPNGITVGDSTDDTNRCILLKYDSQGNCLWGREIKGCYAHHWVSGTNGISRGIDLVLDSSGNVYITAVYRDTLFLDQNIIIPYIGQVPRAFVAKYSSDGFALWAKEIEGARFGIGIDCDNLGFIYAVGMFETNIYENGQVILNGTNNKYEVYVCKMDTAGNLIWINSISALSTDVEVNSLVILNDQSVCVVGSSNWSGTLIVDALSESVAGKYLVKFSSAGVAEYIKTFNYTSSGSFEGFDRIRANSLGELLIEGRIEGSVDFGGISTPIVTVNNTSNPFIAKFDTNGNAIWSLISNSQDTGTGGFGNDVEIDINDNIWFAAKSDRIEYAPLQSAVFLDDSTSWHIVKLNGNGDGLCQILHDAHNAKPLDLATDQFGNVYFVSLKPVDSWSGQGIGGNRFHLEVGKIDSTCTQIWTNKATNYIYLQWNGIVQNSLEDTEVHIFPNPTSNSTIIDFGETPVTGEFKLRNSLGEVVMASDFEYTTSYPLNLGGLSAGIYYLEVLTQENRVQILKVNYFPNN